MYAFDVTVNQSIEDAIETLTAVLKNHHLGIVSDVNVQAIIKNKLDEDIPGYRMLGACNPKLAKRVIDADPRAGTLLPCNIVASENDGKTTFYFMDPKTVFSLTDNEEILAVAKEADEILAKVKAELS
ncbi:MAG TPA: hypothetical protein DD827_08370 [Gammaproteobacteria bacterium]|jgi:uncharacterized protein (DUF302 family)|nr:hypothetical protein [Gammaproteobacteria bacterium]